jgi:uncharacterized repeat protein (TIGR01451 family)
MADSTAEFELPSTGACNVSVTDRLIGAAGRYCRSEPNCSLARRVSQKARSLPRACLALVILVSSGFTSVSLAADGTWSATGALLTPRYGHAAASLASGKVLVLGGRDNGGNALSRVEMYDPAAASWSYTGSLNVIRNAPTATVLQDGKVLVAGGEGESHLNSAEIYDPGTQIWTMTGAMADVRVSHSATRLQNGNVLVAGGYQNGSGIARAEILDPATGTWTATGSMTVPRYQHSATLLPNGKVLVVGGEQTGFTAEIYDPAAGTWTSTAPPLAYRNVATALLLTTGKVLLAGGHAGGYGGSLASAELYDPDTATWTFTGSMAQDRYVHTSTKLPGGKVLVTGGASTHTGQAIGTAELYDPATGQWSDAGSISGARYYHTAALLLNGSVVVAGGFDHATSNALGIAEIYDSNIADATPPQVSCGTADGAWHSTDVTISCTANDPESGLANAADANFTVTTSVPSGSETANAATNSRLVCNTVSGCAMAGPISANKVDKKPPTITISSPAANATYQLNASVAAGYSCVDGGSGLASCQGQVPNGSPINTSSTGTKTFTVTSTDAVANASASTVTYSVVSGGGGGSMSADLGISLSAPNKVSRGAMITYSMTVTNTGRVAANGAVASNTLPPGTAFASASASQGSLTVPSVGSNGTVTANLGTIASGATATIVIVVNATAAPGTVLTDTVSVTSTTQDLNSANNSATRDTTVTKK